MIKFRLRFTILGGHVHVRMFISHNGNVGSLCGTFVVCKGPEFAALLRDFGNAVVISDSEEYGIIEGVTP